MKRMTNSTRSTSNVVASTSSHEGVNTNQLKRLIKVLNSALFIMDDMDDVTFKAIDDYGGVDFYDDVLELAHQLDLNF